MASGTGKRKRTKGVFVRLTEEELAAVSGKADRAGYPLATLFRQAALGEPGPRARRRPPADHKALRQLLGECGRIGNNINQIARHLNTGDQPVIPELQEALRAYHDIRTAIMRALAMSTFGGEAPEDPAPDDH